MLAVKTNAELEQEARDKEEADKAADQKASQVTTALAGHLKTLWEDARRQKQDKIEPLLMKNKRQRDGEYEPDKLAAIREIKSSEVFMGITGTKCRAAKAWVMEILFQNKRPFAVGPTPVPELPEHIMAYLEQQAIQPIIESIANSYMQAGLPPDMNQIMQQVQGLMPQLQEKLYHDVMREAKKMAQKVEDKIDDQLTEGGFYTALYQAIMDVIDYKAGFIKGPIFRKEKVRKVEQDLQTGKLSAKTEETIIPQYERRSPFCIYPSPESTGIDDGYLFDVIYMTKKNLYSLIGLPGFNETEIRAVLNEFNDNGASNWLFMDEETQKAILNDKQLMTKAEKIQCAEFWGAIKGQLLIDWGMEVEDPDADYDICAWLINNHVIKAMLNYDQFGKKPYSKASFDEINDSFWGDGLPEKIRDAQQICNACSRNIVNNIGIASGPQAERNIDRIPAGESKDMWPWKTWDVTEAMMNGAPALNFYTPPLIAEQLVRVYEYYSKIADEHSGVPKYAHGDSNVTGAGNTASGLSMLLGQAARGIKQVIRNIDMNLIAPIVERQYEYNLLFDEVLSLIGDYKIVAKGTAYLMQKEQQAVRKTELLQILNNPTDIQLTGPEGRKKLIGEVVKAQEMDPEDIVPEHFPIPTINQMMMQNQPPQQGPQTLDQAGNPAGGTDTRTGNPERPRGQVSTQGNAGSSNNPMEGMRP